MNNISRKRLMVLIFMELVKEYIKSLEFLIMGNFSKKCLWLQIRLRIRLMTFLLFVSNIKLKFQRLELIRNSLNC